MVIQFISDVNSKVIPGLNSTVRYEGVWESGGILPDILMLGTKLRRTVSITYRPLYPSAKNCSSVPARRSWGGTRRRCGAGRGESRVPVGDHSAHSLDTVLTEPLVLDKQINRK
jgi:hypothetical protein